MVCRLKNGKALYSNVDKNSKICNNEGRKMALKYGDESPLVASIQIKLKKLGYYDGNTTNKIDDLTAKAIIQYKKDRGIIPNNVSVDMDMLKRLQDETGAF